MLRRALEQQQEQLRDQTPSDSETASLTAGQVDEYGSTSAATITKDAEEDESDAYFGDEDDEEEGDDYSYENASSTSSENILQKSFQAVRNFFLLIANVDNLWDSPSNRNGEGGNRTSFVWCVVFFWFSMLSCGYAIERTTFKLLVDRTGPFRLFSAQVITAMHALFLGIGMAISAVIHKRFEWKALGIPIVDVGLMALLDTVHLLLVVISGSHVPPTLIVILVQLTIPLTGLFSQLVHPDGCCSIVGSEERAGTAAHAGRPIRGCGGLSMEHVGGSLIISLAVFAGLAPAIFSLFQPEMFLAMDVLPIRTALNTLLFTFACVPAAASQLFKEYTFLQYKQPVDSNTLNLVLSVFQFIFLLIVSPLVYGLQGLGSRAADDWTTLYPSSQISQNFRHGLSCFWGTLDEDIQDNYYPEYAECDYSLIIVISHVISIIVVGVAVDKIIHAGATKIMYRGLSAGIILAVLAMYIYDIHDPDFNFGPVIDSLHFACTLTLILGAEVYHRVSLQDATFETVYPEIENLYDEEESQQA